jgi:ribosome-associated protein
VNNTSKETSNGVSDAPAGFRVVELTREPVELYKILKFEGMVGSGGEAKAAIAAGLVKLNGEIEIQKRKKVVSGNTIEFGELRVFITHHESVTDNAVAAPSQPENTNPTSKIDTGSNNNAGE